MVISRQRLAQSGNPTVQRLKAIYHAIQRFSVPAPRLIFRPLLFVYVTLRSTINFFRRVFIAEPLFKAACKSYGKNLHTDIFVHWVTGKGDIMLGDNVIMDGLCGITFAARYCERPQFIVGDNSGIGHASGFVVGKRISIGSHCRIASEVVMFDSSGHPSDPEQRKQGAPAPADEVKPITIEDNVWIGRKCIIFPGVTIGEGSVVSAASVVMSDVPPYTVVAGNPARRVASLNKAPASEGAVEESPEATPVPNTGNRR